MSSETKRLWLQIIYNLVYLIVVWRLVVSMISRRSDVSLQDKRAADLILWAFALLALGDTGYIGFRVMVYASGNLDTQINILGRQIDFL